jgi:hypothetical protein
MDIQHEILKAIQIANLDQATGLLKQWGDLNGYENFSAQILLPVLEEFTQDDLMKEVGGAIFNLRADLMKEVVETVL